MRLQQIAACGCLPAKGSHFYLRTQLINSTVDTTVDTKIN